MTPRIRAARPGDLDAVAALYRELDELHARLVPSFFRVPAAGPTRSVQDLALAMTDEHEALLVTESPGAGGDVVGFVHVQLRATPASPIMTPVRRAHIDALVVARRQRGLGLGQALLGAAEAWAAARAATETVLTAWAGNADAERFYTRLGFETASRVLRRTIK